MLARARAGAMGLGEGVGQGIAVRRAVVFVQVASCDDDGVQGALRLRYNVVLLIELERLVVRLARRGADRLCGLAETIGHCGAVRQEDA